jgi:hypothetical protein
LFRRGAADAGSSDEFTQAIRIEGKGWFQIRNQRPLNPVNSSGSSRRSKNRQPCEELTGAAIRITAATACAQMKKKLLITGGAGFIGSHVADELLKHGYSVRVLDVLLPQVHGDGHRRPQYPGQDIELVRADVRDAAAVERALQGTDAVFHLAAAVGVGQSMYEIAYYTSINSGGTAVLLECLAKTSGRTARGGFQHEHLWRGTLSKFHRILCDSERTTD